jgi:hypothetical protein
VREHFAGVFPKQNQQPVFDRRQMYVASLDRDFTPYLIDSQWTTLNDC